MTRSCFFLGGNQLMVSCWFGARWFLGLPVSNNPFHNGDPRNPYHRAPNQQLTISWGEGGKHDVETQPNLKQTRLTAIKNSPRHGFWWWFGRGSNPQKVYQLKLQNLETDVELANAFSIHLGLRFSRCTSTHTMWACIWPRDDSKAQVDSVSVNVQKDLIQIPSDGKVLSCNGNPVRILSIEAIRPLVFPFWPEGKRKTRGKTRWIGRFADKVPWIALYRLFFFFTFLRLECSIQKSNLPQKNLRQDWRCCVKICNTQGPEKSRIESPGFSVWPVFALDPEGRILGDGFIYSLFSPPFAEDSHFDQYFWNGLKPPTSICWRNDELRGIRRGSLLEHLSNWSDVIFYIWDHEKSLSSFHLFEGKLLEIQSLFLNKNPTNSIKILSISDLKMSIKICSEGRSFWFAEGLGLARRDRGAESGAGKEMEDDK